MGATILLITLGCPEPAVGGDAAFREGAAYHVWEKTEITLTAERSYANPYTAVTVSVFLTGPEGTRRCYGFWDGGSTFRVRVLATAPGTWRWRSVADQPDSGLNGKRGTFSARPWKDAEKRENPCRRGMVRATANGHAFDYADGTPYFLVGDTWWAVGTSRYPWRDSETAFPMGPEAGFKDYVRLRKAQGYNSIALIAAFPSWHNDGKPATLKTADGTVLRNAWQQPGTKSAKTMVDEAGNRPFFFPGKVPGLEKYFPDVDRINPAYFRSLDRKIDHLNEHGFVPFIEVARRDVGQAWKKYYAWPDSYTRYIQYLWARYQANICFFSPIHLDSEGNSIPAADWNVAANKVIDTCKPPPFGTLVSCNAAGSSLRLFDHRDGARWITFHQIGNRRTHDNYAMLTEIFHAAPPLPSLNGEPYYAGMANAPGGTDTSALYCRSGMYGSVLSGGFGGHIYGAGGWDGSLWGGNVEKAATIHIWDAMKWPSADQMRHLASFMLSEGRRYQELIPQSDLVSPNKTGKPKGYTGWAYCACPKERDLFFLYFEKECPRAIVSGAQAGADYKASWFDPRNGTWLPAGALQATASGTISLPAFPDRGERSTADWALKLKLDRGT